MAADALQECVSQAVVRGKARFSDRTGQAERAGSPGELYSVLGSCRRFMLSEAARNARPGFTAKRFGGIRRSEAPCIHRDWHLADGTRDRRAPGQNRPDQ